MKKKTGKGTILKAIGDRYSNSKFTNWDVKKVTTSGQNKLFKLIRF